MLAAVGCVGAIGQHGRRRGIANAPTFTPATLFANSEAGAWYDPSDLSTLAQNSDGTTSVSVGDPVGYMADKSGNGNHATQATNAARPVLRQDANGKYYLEFDGTDDLIGIGSIFSSPSFAEICIAWESNADNTGDFPFGFDSNPHALRNLTEWRWPDSNGVLLNFNAAQKAVIVANEDFNTSPTELEIWANRSNFLSGTISNDSGRFTGIVFGDRTLGGGFNEAGKLYGGYVRVNKEMTTSERENLEDFFAEKMGITL